MGHRPVTSAASSRSRYESLLDVALIFVIFFVHAGWSAPDVNEAHYLCKAKHFWDGSWCEGDHFLESADAHLVFFWSCGWLTKYLPLPVTAWLGRVITWALLAWTWQRLSSAIVPRPLYAVLSAALFVAFIDAGNLAGEWVVGGFEAKGLAYAAVFGALGALVKREWNRCWILLGVALALHALVGGWSAIAVGVVWCLDGCRPSLRTMSPGLVLGGLIAAAGLWPTLTLNSNVDQETIALPSQLHMKSGCGVSAVMVLS